MIGRLLVVALTLAALVAPAAAQRIGTSPGVTGFNGRTGAVSPAAGDYSDAQIAPTRSGIGDTNYAIAATDHYLTLTTTLTAQRTFTLPALSGVNDGDTVTIADDLSKINGANTLVVAPSGSDDINGVNASVTLTQPQGTVTFKADKTAGNWLAATVVMPYTAPSHQFLTSWGAGGFTSAQPAAADVSGLAASATTDTTNASNIASGTLGLARLGTSFTNGQLLIGSSTDGELHAATLTAGTNITVTNSAGAITIAASGGGSGCTTSGTSGQWLSDNGAGGCGSNALASGDILVGNGSNLPAAVAMSGGATISNTGAVTLGNPGASTKGGVESKDCSSGGQFVQKINTDGTETCATPSGGGGGTTGGPIFPLSPYFGLASGNVYPAYYTAATNTNGAGYDAGITVVGSLATDSTVVLRFPMPPAIPSGTLKLNVVGLANDSSHAVHFIVSDATVAMGSSPAAATLTAETETTLTYSAADAYTEQKVTLSATPSANDILVVTIKFCQTSGGTCGTPGWGVTTPSTYIVSAIWE